MGRKKINKDKLSILHILYFPPPNNINTFMNKNYMIYV